MNLGLAGKVAIVGGSSRGIGRAIAMALAQEGCNVAICARGEEDLLATAEEVSSPRENRPACWLWALATSSGVGGFERTRESSDNNRSTTRRTSGTRVKVLTPKGPGWRRMAK